MTRTRQTILALLALLILVPLATLPAQSQSKGKIHRLALQISDNDPEKMTAVLNVAANVSTHYAKAGEEVEIAIVAFNAGLHMLRSDSSPVRERIANFSKSMPNVAFNACGNTIEGMTKREGKSVQILEHAKIVVAGVVTLMELDKAGWTIVRP